MDSDPGRSSPTGATMDSDPGRSSPTGATMDSDTGRKSALALSDTSPSSPDRILDTDPVMSSYVEHLSEADLALLAQATGREPSREGAEVDRLLSHPRVYEAIFESPGDQLLTVSPFLVFAAATYRLAAELERASVVEEWVGPHQRLPILDTSDLQDLLSVAERRFFLAELLASFSHVASGAIWVRRGGRLRRRRWSELDPLRLAELLEAVPEAQRPGVYRRLGDVALFLCGVFPDHMAERALTPGERGRLSHSLGEERPGSEATMSLFEELGSRWYKAACATAYYPSTVSLGVVREISERFVEARRVLNVLTDRYLFKQRPLWFGSAG